MKKKYAHLQIEERFVIEMLLKSGMAIRRIADILCRSPNTVSREIATNSVAGVYTAKKADHKAYVARWRSKKQCLKVAVDYFLIWFVEDRLRKKWSPKQISGYLKKEYGIKCSAKAIYKFVEERRFDHLLFWGWNKRRRGRKVYIYNTAKDERKYIESRPALSGIGHLEMDFIVSKQSTWSFLVVVDRLTKDTRIARIPNRKHTTVSSALSELLSGVTVQSITTDNDISFGHWQELEALLNTHIYFTHPYHSWEKGLVENTNRWIRCFVPKQRDILSVTKEDIQEILTFLNDRPREIIGFKTPREYTGELMRVS